MFGMEEGKSLTINYVVISPTSYLSDLELADLQPFLISFTYFRSDSLIRMRPEIVRGP